MPKIKGHAITITGVCPFCGEEWSIAVSAVDFATWQEGELIQNAFPYLSAGERNFLSQGYAQTAKRRFLDNIKISFAVVFIGDME